MHDFKRLAHAVWDCKYHIVWCPKYRFQILKGDHLGQWDVFPPLGPPSIAKDFTLIFRAMVE